MFLNSTARRSLGWTTGLSFLAVFAFASVAQAQPSNCNGRTLSAGSSITPDNTGGTVTGSVTSSAGTYYTVTAVANATYYFTFCSNGGSTNYDPWLCLYNSSGSLLTQNDDSCGLQSQIAQALAPGTYYIAVSGYSTSAGSYTMAYYAPGVIANVAPSAPTNLEQLPSAGGQPQAPGYVSDPTIYFRATLNDPDANDTLGLQVEILPSTQVFASTTSGTLVQTPDNALVANGADAEVLLNFTTAGLPSGNYHWRGRTFDQMDNFGPWTVFNAATVHFATDFLPPTPPSDPLSPNGVQLIYLAPTGTVPFSWGSAVDSGPPGPIGYRIEVSTNPGFSAVIYDATLSAQGADVSLSASDTPYYWRVSAIDQAGNASAPTATAIFQLSWTTPTAGSKDRHANCGVTTAGGSPFMLALAALAGLLGLASSRRRTTA